MYQSASKRPVKLGKGGGLKKKKNLVRTSKGFSPMPPTKALGVCFGVLNAHKPDQVRELIFFKNRLVLQKVLLRCVGIVKRNRRGSSCNEAAISRFQLPSSEWGMGYDDIRLGNSGKSVSHPTQSRPVTMMGLVSVVPPLWPLTVTTRDLLEDRL